MPDGPIDPTDPLQAGFFELVEKAAPAVAAFSGVRQQFIEAGWPSDQAGEAALLLLRTSIEAANKTTLAGGQS